MGVGFCNLTPKSMVVFFTRKTHENLGPPCAFLANILDDVESYFTWNLKSIFLESFEGCPLLFTLEYFQISVVSQVGSSFI